MLTGKDTTEILELSGKIDSSVVDYQDSHEIDN